jgi:hypothetical protein
MMRNTAIKGALGAALVFLAASAGLAGELGRVEFQGKTVILFDDGQWRPAVEPSCDAGSKLESTILPISMCFDRSVWLEDKPTGAWETMFQSKNRDLYGGIIPDRFAVDEEFLRKAILDNAADATEGGSAVISVREETKVVLNGRTWNRIVYAMPMNGMKIVYVNYYAKLGDAGAVQVPFFTVESAFKSVLPLIESTAATIKVDLPAESAGTTSADSI